MRYPGNCEHLYDDEVEVLRQQIAELEHKLEVQEKKYLEITKRLSRKVHFLKQENQRLRDALTPAEVKNAGA